MDDPKSKMPGYRWITILAALFLAVLYGGLILTVGLSGIIPGARIPLPARATPTSTAVAVSTPHILVHDPLNPKIISTEDFSLGLGDWGLEYGNGKLEDIDGKLVIQSSLSDQYANALVENFIPSGTKYYVQADFATDIPADGSLGLIFGANESSGTFYLLELPPNTSTCRAWRFTQGDWKQLGEAMEVNPLAYPQPNTLSVYFDTGRMEFYLNGTLIGSFIDKEPLRSTGVGAYISNPGFKLFVDNFFGYSLK